MANTTTMACRRVARSHGWRGPWRAGAVAIVSTLVSFAPVAQGNEFGVLGDLIAEWIGPHAEDAQELAHATIATTRGTDIIPASDPPIELGGAIGKAPQSVDNRRPLRLTWHGGQPPYRVEIVAAAPGGQSLAQTADGRSATVNLADSPPGVYRLSIAGADNRPLSLRLNLVDPSTVPTAPPSPAATTDEEKDVVQSTWLLMRGGVKWRLEALSRLQALADVQGNSVARLILAPSPQQGETHK